MKKNVKLKVKTVKNGKKMFFFLTINGVSGVEWKGVIIQIRTPVCGLTPEAKGVRREAEGVRKEVKGMRRRGLRCEERGAKR